MRIYIVNTKVTTVFISLQNRLEKSENTFTYKPWRPSLKEAYGPQSCMDDKNILNACHITVQLITLAQTSGGNTHDFSPSCKQYAGRIKYYIHTHCLGAIGLSVSFRLSNVLTSCMPIIPPKTDTG